jgi:hypothetical protein
MSHHENSSLGVSFQLPDKITVSKRLAYLNKMVGESMFEKLWNAGLTLITDWKCTAYPDPKAIDLAESEDMALSEIVIWTSGRVAEKMNDLVHVPKASSGPPPVPQT